MMFRRLMPVLGLCLMVMLSACAEKWVKPGATPQQFDAIQAICTNNANVQFPPAIQPMPLDSGHTTPIVTRCTNTPNSTSCVQQGGDYIPPTVIGVDVNEDARDQAVRACLYRNGWVPAKD